MGNSKYYLKKHMHNMAGVYLDLRIMQSYDLNFNALHQH